MAAREEEEEREMREGENIMPMALGTTPTPFQWQRVYFSSSRQGHQGCRSSQHPMHIQKTERDRLPCPFPSHSILVCRLWDGATVGRVLSPLLAAHLWKGPQDTPGCLTN